MQKKIKREKKDGTECKKRKMFATAETNTCIRNKNVGQHHKVKH